MNSAERDCRVLVRKGKGIREQRKDRDRLTINVGLREKCESQ